MLQKLFFNNYLLTLAVLGWACAQVAKTLLHLVMTRRFSAERLVGSGGMPSSHASMVCALFVGSVKGLGISSPVTALSFTLAAIVMVDAMGVRLETGKQARILNRMMEDLKDEGQDEVTDKKLKELVGHTPFQVLSGALLGTLIAVVMPVF